MPVRFKFNVGGQITISVSQLFHYVGHNIESIAIVSVFAQYISLSLSLSLCLSISKLLLLTLILICVNLLMKESAEN